MLMKIAIASCLVALVVVPATEAFGTDFLDWLLGEDSESDESSETVISAKPNTTVMVVCKTECNLNVMCVNCTKIDTTMMKPGNGNGANGQTTSGNGMPPPSNGNGMTTAAPVGSTDAGMAAPGTDEAAAPPPPRK